MIAITLLVLAAIVLYLVGLLAVNVITVEYTIRRNGEVQQEALRMFGMMDDEGYEDEAINLANS